MATRIFFSYAHESEDHKNRLLELCNSFRTSGLDAWIDQYESFPPQGWPAWMLRQIELATFVLVVCSSKYKRRFEGREKWGKGKGAKWEGAVITHALYDSELHNRKFIPIVINPKDIKHIPTILRQYTHFDASTLLGKESLYRLLTDQPAAIPPPVGDVRTTPPSADAVPSPSSGSGRVHANVSFTTSSSGWTVLLKVGNVSDVPLYLENPELILSRTVDSSSDLPQELREESHSIALLPIDPVSAPLLPTQQRTYFLHPHSLSLLLADKKWQDYRPSIRVATAVSEELRLEDSVTIEKLQSLLGIPTAEGKRREYSVRMPLIMSLIHKRCTDQVHAAFKVYPPIEVLEHPEWVASDDVIEHLKNTTFTIVFDDNSSEQLTFPELIVFTEQLISISWQMKELVQQIDKADVKSPVKASLKASINVERLMQPELVKILLSKVAFESAPYNTDSAREAASEAKPQRKKSARKAASKKVHAKQPKRKKS